MPAGSFFNGNAFATAESQFIIGKELVRGTPPAGSSALYQIPAMAPKYKPDLMMLPVDVLQGSMVTTYSYVPGIRYDSHGWNAPPWLDSFPLFVQFELGSADNKTAAPTATTLASASVPGASTITTAASVASGSWITMGSAANGTIETHYVVTGGSTTLTLADPVINALASGTAVNGLTQHQFSLQNAVSTTVASGSNGINVSTFAGAGVLNVASNAGFPTSGVVEVIIYAGSGGVTGVFTGVALVSYTGLGSNSLTGCTLVANQGGIASGAMVTGNMVQNVGAQPPSASIWDFDGEEWRVITAAQLDQLSLKGSGTSLVDYTCTWFGNPALTYQQPPSSYTPETLVSVAPWTYFFQLGGTAGEPGTGTFSPTVTDWSVDFKRGVKPIPALTGQQNYFQYFAGPITPTVKFTFVEQPGSPQLNAFLNATTTPLEMTVFDQVHGATLNIRCESLQYTTGELDRTKEWVQIMVDGTLLPTGTFTGAPGGGDALAGGVSPTIVTVANSVTTQY